MGRQGLKISILLAVFVMAVSSLGAQERYISLNPVSIASGYVSAEYEQRIEYSQFFWKVSPVFYNVELTNFLDDNPVGFGLSEESTAWGLGISGGAVYYLMNDNPSGFFFGGRMNLALLNGWVNTSYAAGVATTGEIQQHFRFGMNFDVGYRWIWDNFSIASFAGVGYGLILGGDYSTDFSEDQALFRVNMNPDTVLEKMTVIKMGDGVLLNAYAYMGILVSFSF